MLYDTHYTASPWNGTPYQLCRVTPKLYSVVTTTASKKIEICLGLLGERYSWPNPETATYFLCS